MWTLLKTEAHNENLRRRMEKAQKKQAAALAQANGDGDQGSTFSDAPGDDQPPQPGAGGLQMMS